MANDINRIILVGRLTRNAELKYTNSGMAVSKFSVAVNKKKKSGDAWVDEASFFDMTYFGKGAEAVNQYLTKGTQVAIDGELKQNRWEQDGQQRSKIEVMVNYVQLLGGGNRVEQNQSQGYKTAPSRNDSNGFNDDIPWED